jgi:hypothetical protein
MYSFFSSRPNEGEGKSCVESRDSSNEEDMVTWVQDKMSAYVSKVEKSWHRHQIFNTLMRSPNRPPFAVPELMLSNERPPQGQNVPSPEHGIISGLQYHIHWPGFSRVPGAYFAICFMKYLRYRDCRKFGIS